MSRQSQYQFGNQPVMETGYLSLETIQKMPEGLETAYIPLDRYTKDGVPKPESPEWQLSVNGKLTEIRDNWRIIEEDGRTLEVTMANMDALGSDCDVMLRVSQSTITDEVSEAVALAHDAVDNPDMAIIHVVMPGHGGSSGLTHQELSSARRDGSLVGLNYGWDDGKKTIDSYDPMPSYKAMALILEGVKGSRGEITHLSAEDRAAHVAPALMSALSGVQRAVLTDPTNLQKRKMHFRDLIGLGQDLDYIRTHRPKLASEMADAVKYEEESTDPLSITDDRIDEAKLVLGSDFFEEAGRIRKEKAGSTKKRAEVRIYMQGPSKGNAAAIHILAALAESPDAKVTYIFPERSSNYGGRYHVFDLIETIHQAYSDEPKEPDVEGILTPVGKFWSRPHPLGRLALQREAFNR